MLWLLKWLAGWDMVAAHRQTWCKKLDPGRFLEVMGLSDVIWLKLKSIISFEAMRNDGAAVRGSGHSTVGQGKEA